LWWWDEGEACGGGTVEVEVERGGGVVFEWW